MFDVFLENLKRALKSRLLPVAFAYIAMFAILINRIFVLQIVEGEDRVRENASRVVQNREIKSTRGNIKDRNGKLLAYNELAYTVTMEDTGMLKTNEEKNKVIIDTIRMIEKYDGDLATKFLIEVNKKGGFEYTADTSRINIFKRDIYYKTNINLLSQEQLAAGAEEVYYYLKNGDGKNQRMFGISDEYTVEETLKIMSVRYALLVNSSTKYLPITIANNVNNKIVAAVKESGLTGVDILQETHRVYNDSIYMAHILGYTGLISQETLESYRDKGLGDNYSITDQVGKSGIELIYEEELHGQKGNEEVLLNSNRTVLEVLSQTNAVAGNDVFLTIDSKLQKAAYIMLEKSLAGILIQKIHSGTGSGSKGKSASKITIPIYDVYYALIKNNIIDITALNEEDSTNLEKSVYQKYTNKQRQVFRKIDETLAVNSKLTSEDITKEMKEYLDYIYKNVLINNKILLSDSIDRKDSVYLDYSNGKVSLSAFLQHAIAMNWVDLSLFDIGEEEYFTTEELYEKLLATTKEMLKADAEFGKKLYNSLVYSFQLTGKEICLLLFDQGVLKYNKDDIAALKAGSVSPYTFMIRKIKKLEITPAQLALEPCSGSVVVTDVKTGEVITLVSYPSYDNNKFANTVDPEYSSLIFSNHASPIINRPLQQKTAPGSTYKMLTAAAGIEEGVVGIHETIKDKGIFDKIAPPAKCWAFPAGHTHGNVDVANALEVSCNYYFYELGYRLSLDTSGKYRSLQGLKALEKYAKLFGFDSKTGIELAEADPKISDYDSVRSSIGQGTNNYTPAQLSRYVTAVASHGKLFQLTILDKIKDVDGTVVSKNKTEYEKINLKSSTWAQIQQGMQMVISGSDSTIKKLFKDFDVQVAGKTGTAQESLSKPNHALFVSYAPYEKPEISVTVVIPNGYTSSNAAELSRNIYRYYFGLDSKKNLLNKEVSTPEIASGISD